MKFGRICLVIVLAVCLRPLPGTAEEAKKESAAVAAEPYSADEFPQWARDLRRAEVVAFGSLPFALFFSKTAIDSYRYSQNDWDRRYAPWPLKSAGAVPMTENEYKTTFATACAVALAVALADYIVVKVKRHGERKVIAEKPKAGYTIERSGPPPDSDRPAEAGRK